MHTTANPKLLQLYSGPEDDGSLDHILKEESVLPSSELLALDICRDNSHDLLQPRLYHELCSWASEGKLIGVIGGPMCRTWSIRRHIRKPGFPEPVRGRNGDSCWGLANLSQHDKESVEGDSILLLRQMYISSLTFHRKGPLPITLLEHPADPSWASTMAAGKSCSSIWATKAVQQWVTELKLNKIDLDQCCLGQVVAKTTTRATNLPLLHWHNMFATTHINRAR